MQQPHTLLLRHPIGHRPRLPQRHSHRHQATRLRRLPHHITYLRQLPQLRSNQRPRLTIYFVEIKTMENTLFDKWDIIGNFLIGYTSDDRVLYSDILYRYLNNEEIDANDILWIETTFKSRKEIEHELNQIDDILLKEAIFDFYRTYDQTPTNTIEFLSKE